MAKLKLLNTIFSKLSSLSKNDGQIVVTRDSKSLYIDLEGERIEITDWINVDNEESLLAILSPLTNKYYYTKDTNKIWRYVGSEWICLNNNINEMMPTYTESTTLTKLKSGEKISVAFGKISKAVTDLISHIGDSIKHITSEERTNWDSAKTHADSVHARTDATKVEKSTTNGNIKINGNETIVYTHPSGTNPHGTTKSDVGLGNVGNFKAVSTVASQGLTDTEKANARTNIGAGTSSLGLGETSSTAYRGDRGKTAYDHSQTAHAPSNAQVNVIETVKVNGTALTPSSKAVDITIPSVGNGTITIKQAGTTKGTFTTNQSGDTTIELTDNNTTYGVATSSALGLIKSGTDITVDSNGNVSVNDDSHNHVISNIDGLQTALDGKAPNSHTHNYLPLSGGTVTGNITAPRFIGKADSLQGQFIEGAPYVTDDTHILQLGYWNCTGAYDRATLLISSAFWGNQHGSGDIIHISQDISTNSDPTVQCSLARTKLHVTGNEREFYFKVDDTNKRIYLYVKVFGGNGYGRWNICPIMFEGGTWVTEAKFNQPTTDLIFIPQNYASTSHTHNYAGSSSAGGAANSLAGFTNTTTLATSIDNATQNGHVYVDNTSGIISQNDGACYVQAYSSTWVHQIYGDYRTGQIAVRGKNNGTWQSWRKVLDSLNYKSYCLPLSGGTLTGALNFANGTWNIVGDDVAIGDHNIAGSLGVKGLNGTPKITFFNQNDDQYANIGSSGNTTLETNATIFAIANNKATIQYNTTNECIDFVFN